MIYKLSILVTDAHTPNGLHSDSFGIPVLVVLTTYLLKEFVCYDLIPQKIFVIVFDIACRKGVLEGVVKTDDDEVHAWRDSLQLVTFQVAIIPFWIVILVSWSIVIEPI